MRLPESEKMSKYGTLRDLQNSANQINEIINEASRFWELRREKQALTGGETRIDNQITELGIIAYKAGLKPVHLDAAAQALNYGGYFWLTRGDGGPVKPLDKYKAGRQAAAELKTMLHWDRVRDLYNNQINVNQILGH
jgi:hypothetical protein